jgi:hypothetical protein
MEMAKLISLYKGEIPAGAEEDFRGARRLEQYRLGERALYLPQGLRWGVLPLASIRGAEPARRVITAGHCVTVREEKPALDLVTEEGSLTLNFERAESRDAVLAALRGVLEGGKI